MIRAERAKRIRDLGIVSARVSEVERGIGPPYDHPNVLKLLGDDEVNRPLPWTSLSQRQRDFQAIKMAIHAAMVDRMDREIARVIGQLRAMNVFDDTLILFLSDNGASAEMMVRDDGHDKTAPAGSAGTHLCLGPGWSSVANTPFRRHKTWVHEGGISTPLIVHWPRGIAARGELRRDPGHVVDVVPTIMELTGANRLTSAQMSLAPVAPGMSLVNEFGRDGAVKHAEMWWQHEGNRAIRVGDWKLVAAGEQGKWELYDLSVDRTETNDLAKEQPERVRELARRWKLREEEYAGVARGE